MVSGRPDPKIVSRLSRAVDEFIAKPYEPAQLADTVRSLLQG
jgi:hypothetical protein